jgi:hypothetical protein
MTRHVTILIVLIAAITLSQNVAGGEIPLPAGQYSITVQGSVNVCVNPGASRWKLAARLVS